MNLSKQPDEAAIENSKQMKSEQEVQQVVEFLRNLFLIRVGEHGAENIQDFIKREAPLAMADSWFNHKSVDKAVKQIKQECLDVSF